MVANSNSNSDRVELPAEFAEHAASVSGLDTPPETLEAWWTAVFDQFSEIDRSIGLEDMYSEEPTRHEVRANDRVRYAYCAVDALAAAVMEPQGAVTVRSIDPVSGRPVTISVSDDAVQVAPEEALICYGSSLDPEVVDVAGSFAAWSVQTDHDAVEAAVCRYTNAFESEDTYERWASEVESVTAPLPPRKVVRLIQRLIRELD